MHIANNSSRISVAQKKDHLNASRWTPDLRVYCGHETLIRCLDSNPQSFLWRVIKTRRDLVQLLVLQMSTKCHDDHNRALILTWLFEPVLCIPSFDGLALGIKNGFVFWFFFHNLIKDIEHWTDLKDKTQYTHFSYKDQSSWIENLTFSQWARKIWSNTSFDH